MSTTVMFIHGAWLTSACWDLFRSRYESQGYEVMAPPWPLEDMPLYELRHSPHPKFGKLTIGKIVRHYESFLRRLPEQPIIIGHSFGGLFTQLLLDRGWGAAGAALAPAPIRGVVPTSRSLLSARPVLTAWRGWSRALTMTFEQFSENFAQTLPETDRRAAYDRYIVPAPGRLYYQGVLGFGAGVRAGNPYRAPLLLIAGEKDRTVEMSMVEAAYDKQRLSPSQTAFKAFPGMSHFLFAEPGWEEVADYAIQWASEHVRPAAETQSPASIRRAAS
jgi:pimeloyl-ACP methyl ester carboxylesterase